MHDQWRKVEGTGHVQCKHGKVRGNYLPTQKSFLRVRWILGGTQITAFVKHSNMLPGKVTELFLRRIFKTFLSGMLSAHLTCPEGSGPRGIPSAPQFLELKPHMHFLSRLVKLNELLGTVISYPELKVAVFSKFIEACGFTIPEQLLFLVFISCVQSSAELVQAFSFCLCHRTCSVTKRSSCLFFWTNFLMEKVPQPKWLYRQFLVSVCSVSVCSGRHLVCSELS